MKRITDVVAISETKLYSNSIGNINISNYKFLHNDSAICAGAVGLFIKETTKFCFRDDLLLHLQDCEDLWLEIKFNESNLYIVTPNKNYYYLMINFVRI